MKKFKGLTLVLSALFILFLCSAASAEKTVYKAGIINDYGFAGNHITQYAQRSVKDIFAEDNALTDFREFRTSAGIDALNGGSIDFLSMVPKNDAFLAYIDYTEEPMAVGFLTLLTKNENELFYEDFENFNNIKIAILENSYFEPMLNQYSKSNNFTYTPVYFGNVNDMNGAVSRKEVDAMLVPATERPEGMRLIAKCGIFEYYGAVKKGNSQMLSVLNQNLENLKMRSPFFVSTNYGEELRLPYLNMAGLTEDEYLSLLEQKKIRLLVEEDNYPLSFYNKEKDRFEGVLISIADKIGKTSGLEIEYVPYKEYDATLNNIIMGQGDALLTASGDTTGLIEATVPYTSISYIPVAKKTASIFEDNSISVGVLTNDLWISSYLSETHPQWEIKEYKNINSLLRASETGKIEMALISSTDMQTKTSLIARPSLTIISDFTISIPVCLGIAQTTCNDDIVHLLNKTISNMSVPEAELENKVYTLSHIYIPNFRDMIYANKYLILVFLLIIAAVIVIIKLRERHFRRLARTDAVTGIHNKLYFDKATARVLSKNPGRNYLLALADAKNFKMINSRFGRDIGDQALRDIAKGIERTFKGYGIYARYQSDKFVILTEDIPENRYRISKLEKLDIQIHNSSKYHIAIRTGVCPVTNYGSQSDIEKYIDYAVIAKSSITGTSSDATAYFTDEMKTELDFRNSIEVEMVSSLYRNEFIVYYQPKYELKTDTIIGAEALVRWNHREMGIVSPGMFIPQFERNGFITRLDFYVYEEVMKMLKSRIVSNLPVVPVSMNVSRCHLGDRTFVKRLEMLVKKYDIPKKYIEMEITESIFSQDDTESIILINELKENGFTISMDDFGSGYSSLNLLRKVPIDTLKIDKVFIDGDGSDARSHVIVEEIINMASKINVKTICEGVETQQQRDFLKGAGCDMVQGFFYSRPLPYVDFETLLNSSN